MIGKQTPVLDYWKKIVEREGFTISYSWGCWFALSGKENPYIGTNLYNKHPYSEFTKGYNRYKKPEYIQKIGRAKREMNK